MPSVLESLDDAAARRPDAPAVRDASGCDSYAELAEASRTVQRGLAALGVRPGDRVVLRLPAGRDFVRVLYGVLRAGAAAVPVHPATGPVHLDWILRDCAPALVVQPAADSAATTDPAALYAVASGPGTGGPPSIAGSDVALLMYTSGSTGMPRAVVCPHVRVRFAADAIGARLGYTARDVVLSRVPVSFDYGLYQLFLCARAGAVLVLRPDLLEASLLRETRATGATVLPLVPSLAAILLRLARRDPGPTRVRLLTNTGAALTAAHADGLRVAFPGAGVVAMYGMTECKRIAVAEPDEDAKYPGTVGRPLDGTEVFVTDDAGRPVPPGVTGEIRVRGPHVMAGYWRAPEATGERFGDLDSEHPLLRTGDYGWLDDGGRLFFAGRRDDIFKRRSVRMNTFEVEAVMQDVPGITAAAVLPPGPDGVLTAYVVGDVDPAALPEVVGRRAEPAKVPDRYVVLPALPTTVNGKVDKDALRRSVEKAAR